MKPTAFSGYSVTVDGRVWSTRQDGRWLRPKIGRTGYLTVCLRDGVRGHMVFVHRLVAAAFIPRIDGKRIVNHKDGDKLNNHASNLEWATHSDNMRHANRTGLVRQKTERKSRSSRATALANHAKARAKTHCRRGHEYTAENTYIWATWRCCRVCRHENYIARKRTAGDE